MSDTNKIRSLADNIYVKQKKMINVKFIRSIVEQVTELDLSNGNRKRDYSDARAIYYKICRDMTKSTIEYIGKEVGRDHATVLHGIKNVFPVVDKQLYVEVMNKIDSTAPVTERLEGIAKRLSEEILPLIYSKVDWQIADTDSDGDDYAAIHASVTRLVINKMLLQTKYDC